ncbi:hypothetical protein SANTM175S_05715 [Streptomyces antimycoticus]
MRPEPAAEIGRVLNEKLRNSSDPIGGEMSVQTATSRDEIPEEISAINLVDTRTYLEHDMDAYWRRLRADHPLYWHPPVDGKPGFWVVSRYADVMALYRDNQRLTSEKGNVLVTLLAGGDSAAGQMLAVTDGRRHKDLRNVMLKAFSPRALSKVAALVRVNARRMIADAVRRGEGDFAAEVASVIPLTTVGGLLGVPVKDHSYLLGLTKSSLSSDEADQAPEEAFLARNEILLYFSDLVAERRADPQDDVISTLTASEIDGVPLTDQDIVFNCYSLILGGDETSRLTMIDSLYSLSREPEQWKRLKEGSVTLESAAEEALRWATPAMNFGRTALVDIMAGGTIKAGDVVTLCERPRPTATASGGPLRRTAVHLRAVPARRAPVRLAKSAITTSRWTAGAWAWSPVGSPPCTRPPRRGSHVRTPATAVCGSSSRPTPRTAGPRRSPATGGTGPSSWPTAPRRMA